MCEEQCPRESAEPDEFLEEIELQHVDAILFALAYTLDVPMAIRGGTVEFVLFYAEPLPHNVSCLSCYLAYAYVGLLDLFL